MPKEGTFVALGVDVSSENKKTSRWRGRGGNTFVEFALCALPLLGMFLGVSDVAFAVFMKSMFQNAVRDGVRYAITFSTTFNGTNCSTQSQCIKLQVQNSSLGFLNGSSSSYITVNFYSPDNLSTPLTSSDVGPGKKLASGANLMYMNQTGNLVEVSIVNFPYSWMAPIPKFWSSKGIVMSAASSDILQGYPVGTTTPPTP